MKTNLLFATLFTLVANYTIAQCSNVSSSISSSTPTQLNMYTPASFFITPSASNTYVWKLTKMDGTILFWDSTASNFQLMNFAVPLTDSLKVCQTVVNSSTGTICSVCDTLTNQGSINNWRLVTTNTGYAGRPKVDTASTGGTGGGGSTSSINSIDKIEAKIFPNPTSDFVTIQIEGSLAFSVTLFDIAGKQLITVASASRIDLTALPKGVYFLEIRDENSNGRLMKKVVKQ